MSAQFQFSAASKYKQNFIKKKGFIRSFTILIIENFLWSQQKAIVKKVKMSYSLRSVPEIRQ